MDKDPRKIYHGILRNGYRTRYRHLAHDEQFQDWTTIGWTPHNQQFFSAGDADLWKADGRWRYDDKDSPFDIVQTTGLEMAPGVVMPITTE